MINAGIIGSTGYAGQQLAWILSRRSDVTIKFLCAHSFAGTPYSEVYKNYYGFIHDLCISMQDAEKRLNEIDVLFLGLPNGNSFEITKKAVELGVKVIDVGSDYRLKNPCDYKKWYKLEHGYPEILPDVVYGLSELYRNDIKNARIISNPGCYPTASILACSPAVKNNLIDTHSIIIDAKSGVSGAGRSAKIDNLFCECGDSIKAYGVTTHRHTPEIEQELSRLSCDNVLISFTPHLTPMKRGILATCYANLKVNKTIGELYNIYREFYKDEYFIKVVDFLPETRYVTGSNLCHIALRLDERTNRLIVISAIDNLIKGAAGQAVQNMNIMFGLEETKGLDFAAMVP